MTHKGLFISPKPHVLSFKLVSVGFIPHPSPLLQFAMPRPTSSDSSSHSQSDGSQNDGIFNPDSLMDICRDVRFQDFQQSTRRTFTQVELRQDPPFQTSSADEWTQYFMSEGDWVANQKYYTEQWAVWKAPARFEINSFARADECLLASTYTDDLPFSPLLAESSYLIKSLILAQEYEVTLNYRLNCLDELSYFESLCPTTSQALPNDFRYLAPRLQRIGHHSLRQLGHFRRRVTNFLDQHYGFLKTDDPRADVERVQARLEAAGAPSVLSGLRIRFLRTMYPAKHDLPYLWSNPQLLVNEFKIQGLSLDNVRIQPSIWWDEARRLADWDPLQRPRLDLPLCQ